MFIQCFKIATGRLDETGGPVDHVARDVGASPAQVALAWLLQRSPVVLPIPGTKSIDHLKDNMRAASVTLSPTQVAALDAVA